MPCYDTTQLQLKSILSEMVKRLDFCPTSKSPQVVYWVHEQTEILDDSNRRSLAAKDVLK